MFLIIYFYFSLPRPSATPSRRRGIIFSFLFTEQKISGFLPSKTFFMDFFMRNFKKITIGWMLLLFVFWLVPRVCSFGDSLLVDYALVTIFYIALFVIAIISFSIIVLIEVISTKKYKWLGKLFVVLVVPVMLLAVTGLYRFWMDCWGDPMCFLDAQEAKQNGVFYA